MATITRYQAEQYITQVFNEYLEALKKAKKNKKKILPEAYELFEGMEEFNQFVKSVDLQQKVYNRLNIQGIEELLTGCVNLSKLYDLQVYDSIKDIRISEDDHYYKITNAVTSYSVGGTYTFNIEPINEIEKQWYEFYTKTWNCYKFNESTKKYEEYVVGLNEQRMVLDTNTNDRTFLFTEPGKYRITAAVFKQNWNPFAQQIPELNEVDEIEINVYGKNEKQISEELNYDSWKIYLDKNNSISKVEYGIDKTKVQIIDSEGQVSKIIEMVGKEYDGKGFAKKLLTAAGIETTEQADADMQNKMLDDGLFYINSEEGWIEKQKYFERMTAKDFLTIQDYKDVTVKAVYKDNGSTGTLTFTYTVGGKTENLFVINASNNQKAREYPTKSGDNITDDPDDFMYTTPPFGKTQVPYIPGKFPIGNWHITKFEYDETTEYGPYKIRTDAYRMVEVWELVTNKKRNIKEWRKKKNPDGTIVMAEDAGLLIHGGGYSEINLDNRKGSNKYTDNTLGCIRISNLDVLLIVETLQEYLKIKTNIDLQVY